jgi:hypothetical protein
MNDSKHSPQSKYLRYRSFALDILGGFGLFSITFALIPITQRGVTRAARPLKSTEILVLACTTTSIAGHCDISKILL